MMGLRGRKERRACFYIGKRISWDPEVTQLDYGMIILKISAKLV
jgi:hypothetical protein